MDKYRNYLTDTIFLLKEKIEELKSDEKSQDPFMSGQKNAYYDVLTIFKEQAALFDIDLADIGLHDFDENSILM